MNWELRPWRFVYCVILTVVAFHVSFWAGILVILATIDMTLD